MLVAQYIVLAVIIVFSFYSVCKKKKLQSVLNEEQKGLSKVTSYYAIIVFGYILISNMLGLQENYYLCNQIILIFSIIGAGYILFKYR